MSMFLLLFPVSLLLDGKVFSWFVVDDMSSWSFCLCRLVMVDVAFYSENVQALRSLERLDLNMPEIWEQKRWWRTARAGQSGLSVTSAITVTSSEVSGWTDSALEVWCVWIPLRHFPNHWETPVWTGRAPGGPADFLRRPNQAKLEWWIRRSWELWGICCFVVVKRRLVLSASFSTATTVQRSIRVQFCLIIVIIIAELFNHRGIMEYRLFILIDFDVGWSIMFFCFFSHKAFRW